MFVISIKFHQNLQYKINLGQILVEYEEIEGSGDEGNFPPQKIVIL